MYRYDAFDSAFVRERVEEFRSQVARRLSGSLTEDEFKPLRLMNGVYLQLHAYMLRIAIPYGTLSSGQLRQIAIIADRWDRGYGHFTTRQNIQFNWPRLRDIPDILDALADVEMHAIQTSGNCIRNVTADQFAGVAADEVFDPRPTAEWVRQWSSLHPEFSFLPRKFKIAVTGAAHDRAAIMAHDIGLRLLQNRSGERGYQVIVGGGLGRSPFIGKTIKEFVREDDLLIYLEALMRVYNAEGRRDNKYKARVKILVHEKGLDDLQNSVEVEFATLKKVLPKTDLDELRRIEQAFVPPAYDALEPIDILADVEGNEGFKAFIQNNLFPHRVPGYTAVTISLKAIGEVPGDVTSSQMRALAEAAETFGFCELRVSHSQNVILPDIRQKDLEALYHHLSSHGLATGNVGLITDIIACPGLDYCSLATARSIPIAQAISRRFADPSRQRDIGELGIKISGCINACGHHHLGAIGILGLEKNGVENYQITLGGHPDFDASLGERLGPGVPADAVPDVVEEIVEIYRQHRHQGERFIDTVRRVGVDPFREALHAYSD